MTSQQKLALLLQPALIRLIDQLRQQLTEASWTWSYDTIEVWPDEVPEETRSQYTEMMEALETASDDDAETIQDVLYTLPQPIPLYRLDVTYEETELEISMWQLCYQICFEDYRPKFLDLSVEAPELEKWAVDPALIDEADQVDWVALNEKAKTVVSQLMTAIQSGNCK